MYCHHCQVRLIARPRHLCVACFADRAIRGRYRPRTTNRPNRRTRVRPAPEPTAAPPGSLAKVAVLELRAALRVALFHPHDA